MISLYDLNFNKNRSKTKTIWGNEWENETEVLDIKFILINIKYTYNDNYLNQLAFFNLG